MGRSMAENQQSLAQQQHEKESAVLHNYMYMHHIPKLMHMT